MNKSQRILIVGGYGLVGSNIARLIRKKYPDMELILGGRNPENGKILAEEIGKAETARIDLEKGFDIKVYGKIDLIIVAMDDHYNVLRETAIANHIAIIYLSEVAEEISTTVFHSLHHKPSAPVVFAGHWQAGLLTLMAKKISQNFNRIDKIETVGLYDELDPIGPLVASQLDGFVGRALVRKHGKWQFVDAKANAKEIVLRDQEVVTGFPMSTLDVPSIAAFTAAPNIRFDFATGRSIGTSNGLAASHDLYLDFEGVLLSGLKTKLRTVISGPKGQGHLTAVGAFLAMEEIFGFGEGSEDLQGGLHTPETLIPTANITKRLSDLGVHIIETDH